ncbi:MAG: sigma-70 family RNA polymerase sigma factor [Deltaproteobacteria bacterium]|nr:sigma-70 family RNA polymerase sigma factor [Deltaproteobacteria bacterium]
MTDSLQKDLRLLSRCLDGDREASELFVRRFSGLIYYAVRYVLTSKCISFGPEDLEDLHNSVFLDLFENKGRKLSQYHGKNGCSLASWLRVVAVRRVLNHIRDGHMHTDLPQEKQVPFENFSSHDREELGPLALMEQAERGRLVRDAVQFLSPRDRLFMKLYFEDGLALEEVADTLRISIQNAYTIKHRAVQRLRSHLSRDT